MQMEIQIPPLRFSPVGAEGDDYPEWVRALNGQSGAYVIALQTSHGGDAPIVYVGESHSGRLYETLTRHFQRWERRKVFWEGQYGREDSPGVTYPRALCLVAVVLAPGRDRRGRSLSSPAEELQWKLIELLQPRDNRVGQVDENEQRDERELAAVGAVEELEEAPF